MEILRRIRQHPELACLFDYVHALCWPILIWEILTILLWMRKTGIRDFLYTVDRWGFIDITHAGDVVDPSAYRAPDRMFKPLTDASWESALPVCLSGISAFDLQRPYPRLSRLAGEASGALKFTVLDTS